VRQGIIEPRREHSRKPDCIHERIERLVAGPYVELFARQRRPGWDCWGNEVDKFNERRVTA
jgi:N6-adenosine-specific RNA methylase IME4